MNVATASVLLVLGMIVYRIIQGMRRKESKKRESPWRCIDCKSCGGFCGYEEAVYPPNRDRVDNARCSNHNGLG